MSSTLEEFLHKKVRLQIDTGEIFWGNVRQTEANEAVSLTNVTMQLTNQKVQEINGIYILKQRIKLLEALTEEAFVEAINVVKLSSHLLHQKLKKNKKC